ncbi:MAG: hypothetical protein ACP5U1_14040, partial [Desulfomonilaceae bacterium]
DVKRKFKRLKELLNREFVFDPLVPEAEVFEQSLKLFENYGWVSFDSLSDSFDVKSSRALKIYQGLIYDILGVYKACMATISQIGEETISERDFIGLATKIGREVNVLPSFRNVALSTVTVRSALRELTKLKMADYNHSRKKISRGKLDPTSFFDLG